MSRIKSAISAIAQHDLGWKFLRPIAKVGAFLLTERNRKDDAIRARQLEEYWNRVFEPVLGGLVVLHGPFQGMKYPALTAAGSALYPKLLGCYEKEIHPILEDVFLRGYDEIINIGCAEGYYAIGIAMRLPGAAVYAYDLDPVAREQTVAMARLNGVAGRVVVESVFLPQHLGNLKAGVRTLIVCDCEGYEKTLFTSETVPFLRDVDLLIEVHDFIDIEISLSLKRIFQSTHLIQSVKSVDDIEKTMTYQYPEAMRFDLKSRKVLFAEGRPAQMEWLLLTAKPR